MSSEENAVPAQVWVAETWCAHGEESQVQGVYDSREAARDGLKDEVDTLYVDDAGLLRGRPRGEPPYGFGARWAMAGPMEVRGRTPTERSSPG